MTRDALDTLVRMANQIAANVPHDSDAEAAQLVATHLRSFWAPPMRADLLAYVDGGGAGVDPIARAALDLIRPAT
jgi:formate dehydrogenase subunit delta